MEKIMLIACFLAITVYMAVAAWEDYKSCEVTRWKHLIGGIPAIFLFGGRSILYTPMENAMILAFSAVCILIGMAGIYGMADGYLLAILNLFCSGICGLCGGGIVLLIMTYAAFSFLLHHVAISIAMQQKIFRQVSGPLIPHLFSGYIAVLCMVITKIM